MKRRQLFSVILALASGTCAAATSPDGRAAYAARFAGGRLVFDVTYDRRPVATVATGERWQKGTDSGPARKRVGSWKTVWGERSVVKEAFAEEHFDVTDAEGRAVKVEARIYDEGFAFRCRLSEGGAFEERTSVDYPADARAWAIEETEGTYPPEPLPLAAGPAVWRTPLTVASSAGLSSFFDACAVGYPRLVAVPRAGGFEVKLLQAEAPVLKAGAATAWRALQLAADPAQLVDASTLVLNLNPPCALAETGWIKPGLTLSNLSNCRLDNRELLAAARAERASGVRYLQLDWGWYGTERGWSDADRARFVAANPAMRDEPTWRGNTTGNARRAAKGVVPYLPDWQRQFDVDLDLPSLISALREEGVALCLYVRGAVLEKESLDDLFALYRRWGVAGVKPGFVRYGSAADTDWNRQLLEAAARHRLWVDVHDADIPDGRQRTYPNLFLTEGGGGEEGKHPVRQDVTIPFARGLVGPFDYTPMVFTAGRSQAHVLAMLLCYPGPTAVLRGAAAARDRLAGTESCWGWSDARDFVRALPWTYDESRTLDAAVGRRLVTARRAGRDWFVAGMGGAEAETVRLACGFLTPGVAYRLTLWTDDLADTAPCRRTRRTVRTVTAADAVAVALAPAGGFLARFEPLDDGAPRAETCLSGAGWTCDGAPVAVPHTWNAVDGADGLDVPPKQPGHNSVSSQSYARGARTYRRALPDAPPPGRRAFIRCDGVSVKAAVRVNGAPAAQHVGAFSAFTCEVTGLLKPTGNVLEIVADNAYDPDVPPTEGDFTVFGGVYRDVWWIEKPAVCVDPLRHVRLHPDAATGRVRAEVPVSGGPDEVQTFDFGAPELWSPESPRLYRLTVTAGTDRVTVPFGFRTVEMRADGFYLNGVRRQLRGVCRHQDRIGKGWAVSAADEAEDVRWIKRMGADAVRTSHYPQSPAFYRLCDEEGLLVWTEIPLVDEVPATPAFRAHALHMAAEMVTQLAHHPSIVLWGLFNEVYQFKRKPDGTAEPLLRDVRARIRALDPTRPVVGASNRDIPSLCAIPDALGMNLYPGWYTGYGADPEDMAARIAASVRASGRSCIAVSEYGGGGCIDQHGDALTRPAPSGRFHPEEYQAWLHRGNYLGIVDNPAVWGSFAWVMFDLASDSRREGAQIGRNDKGLVTGDRTTAKDAWYFYKCNWNPEPELRIVGERAGTTTNAAHTVVVFSNAPEVMFFLNGRLHGAKVPDRVKTCVWRDVTLVPGENRMEFRAGPQTRRHVLVRTTGGASVPPSREPVR